jgi:hypothetical protein
MNERDSSMPNKIESEKPVESITVPTSNESQQLENRSVEADEQVLKNKKIQCFEWLRCSVDQFQGLLFLFPAKSMITFSK